MLVFCFRMRRMGRFRGKGGCSACFSTENNGIRGTFDGRSAERGTGIVYDRETNGTGGEDAGEASASGGEGRAGGGPLGR